MVNLPEDVKKIIKVRIMWPIGPIGRMRGRKNSTTVITRTGVNESLFIIVNHRLIPCFFSPF